MSDRFARKVWRLTMDWTVEVQSLIDRELRRIKREARAPQVRSRARRSAALGDRRGRRRRGRLPQRAVRLFGVADAADVAALRNPEHRAEVLRAVDRGVGRVEKLEPPTELASWHAAVVAAQRDYETALREVYEARSASAVAAAADRVQQARQAIDASTSSAA